ncbi:hypothetical protein LCGC14_0641350 [marine sediment metagenome]|uniref:Uncharacterized protein n=1 Tax=marine sediment metagenome TaxID=412755 RepID=A0A0F9QZ04_9ZZZZ|nr:hypothetical protein [archaeon]HEC36780.1 hypothetical protein [bacterium]
MAREIDFISIGYDKGEMDFSVNCSIADLTLKEFDELRIMTMVAIGQAENMWRRENKPECRTSIRKSPNKPK